MDWTVVSIIGNVVFVISTGCLGWTSLHLKKKADLRLQRFTVYKQALDEIDTLNKKLSSLTGAFFLSDLQAFLVDMLSSPEHLDDHLLSMNRRFNSRFAEMNDVVNASYSRLNTIRLVASRETLKLLDEYREITRELMTAQTELLNSVKLPKDVSQLKDKKYEIAKSADLDGLTAIQSKYANIRSQLETQMRKDIGY